MRAGEAGALLEQTAKLLGERSWGVGLLGFVPAELRAEQLEVVREHRPPFALIAGGRPDQARELEADGIDDLPARALAGAAEAVPRRRRAPVRVRGARVRRPRRARARASCCGTRCCGSCSRSCPSDASDCQVLLAGGIHDARSAAMAAATAAARERARRADRRADGHRYLFTREATESGAITPLFQEAAIAAADTALLESGPGHATRCLPLPVRRAVRGRAAQPALRGNRRRGAARPPRAAEHRPPAGRRRRA